MEHIVKMYHCHFSQYFTFHDYLLLKTFSFHFSQISTFCNLFFSQHWLSRSALYFAQCGLDPNPVCFLSIVHFHFSQFFTFQNFSLSITFYFSQPYTLHSVAQTPILDACSQEEIDRMSKEVKLKKLNCWISVYKW